MSRPKAQTLKRRDRFPRLPLGITLRETRLVMLLNWRDLLALAWLVLLVYIGLSLAFAGLHGLYAAEAAKNFSIYLIRSEILSLLRAFLLEFLLVGFFALAVFRLMLLGEPLGAPKFSDTWLRRYLAFLGATFQAMAKPLLVFLPYGLFIVLQIIWDWTGSVPGWVPQVLILAQWPTQALKALCALGFYIWFARLVFVQPALAVDVPYSPRESWRVTSWIWGQMLILTLATLGISIAGILAVQMLWPMPTLPFGFLDFVTLGAGLILLCGLWIFGMTAFTVALSIAFCLRTGWRPGAQKLSLNRRPGSRRNGT